jgi:hypothetical protein
MRRRVGRKREKLKERARGEERRGGRERGRAR